MKTYILKTDENGYFVNDTKIIENLGLLKTVANDDAIKVAKALSKKPTTADEIARNLKMPKKTAYFYVNKLLELGILARQNVPGKKADVYRSATNSFSYEIGDANVKLDIREQNIQDENVAKFYRRFVKNGKFDGYICVGSPDPHGEYRAIARDTHYAIYLAMFLGQFCELPKDFPVLLDTDVIARNLFKQNLIVVGGPVTNLITRDINNFLPMKFAKEEGWALKDREGMHSRDYEGVVEKIKNPFDKSKEVIMLGGIRNIGTLSAMLAATRFSKLTFRSYNDEAPWHVLVRGYDIDGDGEIDSVETVQ